MRDLSLVLANSLAALLVTVALPSRASYITINYTGYVSEVDANVTDASGKVDVFLDTPATFSVTFDPSKATLATKTNFKDANGKPIVLHPVSISLYRDKGASYTITVASHTWTLRDDVYHGYTNRNGVGPFPIAAYDGSPERFIGLGSDAVNAEGLELYSSPGDDILGYADDAGQVAPAFVFDEDGDQLFAIRTSLDATLDAIRAEGLAAARVPEPPAVALLVIGAIGIGAVSRRRRRSADASVFGGVARWWRQAAAIGA